MRGNQFRRFIMSISFLFLAAIVFCSAGCQNMQFGPRPASSGGPTAQQTGNAPLYYDFGDILLPSELKMDKANTYIVEGPGFLTGILKLKGRVERASLITFFRNNMAKDNWKAITSFKTPKKAILLFQKETRWCVINIDEDDFNTFVEIGVAPTIGESGSGLLQ